MKFASYKYAWKEIIECNEQKWRTVMKEQKEKNRTQKENNRAKCKEHEQCSCLLILVKRQMGILLDSEECWLLLSLLRMEEGTTWWWKVVKKVGCIYLRATAFICACQRVFRFSFECLLWFLWIYHCHSSVSFFIQMNFNLLCIFFLLFFSHSNTTVNPFEWILDFTTGFLLIIQMSSPSSPIHLNYSAFIRMCL